MGEIGRRCTMSAVLLNVGRGLSTVCSSGGGTKATRPTRIDPRSRGHGGRSVVGDVGSREVCIGRYLGGGQVECGRRSTLLRPPPQGSPAGQSGAVEETLDAEPPLVLVGTAQETTSQTWTVANTYRLCSRSIAGLGGVGAVEGEWPGCSAQNQPILSLSCSAPGRAEEPACAGAWWRSGVSGSRWAKSIPVGGGQARESFRTQAWSVRSVRSV